MILEHLVQSPLSMSCCDVILRYVPTNIKSNLGVLLRILIELHILIRCMAMLLLPTPWTNLINGWDRELSHPMTNCKLQRLSS